MIALATFTIIIALIVTHGLPTDIFETISSQTEESIDMLKSLIESSDDFDVGIITPYGESLLHLACIWGNTEKVMTKGFLTLNKFTKSYLPCNFDRYQYF